MAFYHCDGEVHEGRKWGARTFDSREEAEKDLEDHQVWIRMPRRTRVYPRGGAGNPRWSIQKDADAARKNYDAAKALLEQMRQQGASHEEIMEALK